MLTLRMSGNLSHYVHEGLCGERLSTLVILSDKNGEISLDINCSASLLPFSVRTTGTLPECPQCLVGLCSDLKNMRINLAGATDVN
jgi:hypothetical protein